ncbi:hypothetical protein HRbin16_01350 [bacterium HR16]|nr:hypothetical protein HRbin16_01350 [bacterium HR16]
MKVNQRLLVVLVLLVAAFGAAALLRGGRQPQRNTSALLLLQKLESDRCEETMQDVRDELDLLIEDLHLAHDTIQSAIDDARAADRLNAYRQAISDIESALVDIETAISQLETQKDKLNP